MCPSYMVTREEAHSTRGRANVLRLAMSGQLGDAKLSRRRRARGARSLPRVPRLQERMPGRRRRGAVQERVPRRLLGSPRPVARGPGVRQCAQRGGVGQRASRHSSNAIAASANREVGRRRQPSASIAGGRCRSGRGRTLRQADRHRDQGSGIRDQGSQARVALRRHVHRLCRSGDRAGRDRRDECRRHRHDALHRTSAAAGR